MCIWQDDEQENGMKDSLPAGRTGLRSKTASPTKSKGPRKTVRKKPAAQKTSSVTLTQMVGSSDTKHLHTAADTENVCCFVFFHYFYDFFVRNMKECKNCFKISDLKCGNTFVS